MINYRSAVAAPVAGLLGLLLVNPAVAMAEPEVVGKRYSDAKADFSEANVTPVVSTMVGDKLPQDKCFVVSYAVRPVVDDSEAEVLVNLNCYPKPATAKNPGFSSANSNADAEAVRDTSEEEARVWKQTPAGQKWCVEAAEKHPEWVPLDDCQLEE